jgi:hypothetical protein
MAATVLGMDGDTWGALSVGIGGALVFITAAQESVHVFDGGTASYQGTTTRRSRLMWGCQIVGAALILVGSALLLISSSSLAVLGCVVAALAVAGALWIAMAVDLRRDAERVIGGTRHSVWWYLANCWRDKPL